MAILNYANDGFANILLVICKYLINNGSQNRDEFLEIFSIGKNNNNKPFQETLRRWTQLNLFKEENNQIFFSDQAFKINPNINLENLTSLIRKIIFLEKNNTNLLTSQNTKSGDFTIASSWLLAQPISVEDNNYENLHDAQITDVNKRLFLNNTPYNGLLQYMVALGFASGNDNNFILDPTKAIEEELTDVFQNKNILTAKEFLDNLANLLPILDFGTYRKQIEKHLRSDVFKKTNDFELSETLSFALSRLKQKGKISFERKGDADKLYTFWNFFNDQSINPPFTHVNLIRN